jgi:uncharacterized membrane protein YhhN
MTSSVVLCIALASVFSVVDWWAVARNSKIVEYICKPAATIAFLVAAALISVDDSVPKTWRIIALVFCVFGDVFLMLPKDAFVPGLASFAIAQMCFVVSLATQDSTTSKLIIGLLIVVPTTLFLSRRFITAIKSSGHGELVLPVAVYMVVIAAMATSAIAGGTAIGIAGAMFFLLSDSLIAEHRFVKERGWQSVGIMVTYHVALAGLALGLL